MTFSFVRNFGSGISYQKELHVVFIFSTVLEQIEKLFFFTCKSHQVNYFQGNYIVIYSVVKH